MSASKKSPAASERQRTWAYLMVLFVFALTFYILAGETAEDQRVGDVEIKTQKQHQSLRPVPTVAAKNTTTSSNSKNKAPGPASHQKKTAPGECPRVCENHSLERLQKMGGDVLDSKQLLRMLTTAQEKAIDKLKRDYGEENYANIFEEVVDGQRLSRGRTAFYSEPSWNRFKRKLIIKLLKLQDNIRQEPVDDCNCHTQAATTTQSRRQQRRSLSEGDLHYERFVWATGGHSASAGHGNLHNESYTATLDRFLQPVFASIGIDFEARNYAMGGTASAPEIAMCMDSVFGNDMDLLVWDYGMTDGPWYWRLGFYASRTALNPNRPPVLAMQMGTRNYVHRHNQLLSVEDVGLTTFSIADPQETAMQKAIPDMTGLGDEQIQQVPPLVRNMKCGDSQIETGDPYCRQEKYTATICADRKGQAKWHPGWKMHALTGNLLGLFLMEALVDAAKELLVGNNEKPHEWIAQLQAHEDDDYKTFFNATLPDLAYHDEQLLNLTQVKDIDLSVIYKKKSFCHTARLPAEIRHLGLVTETDQIGPDSYDLGLERRKADAAERKDHSILPLVYEEGTRPNCPVTLKKDFKDYFYTSHNQGWTSLTLPNDSEKREYQLEQHTWNGYLVICLAICDWGRCPDGNIGKEEFDKGDAEMLVNGQRVTGWTFLGGCYALKGDNGHVWSPNEEGKYEFKIRVVEGSFLRVSSFVIY